MTFNLKVYACATENVESMMPSRVVVCPNPECRERIEEPILLNNLSVVPAEHYYACPRCFSKVDIYGYMRRSLTRAGLFLPAFGSAILAWVGWLIWHDVTVWGKDISLIFFGSRTGEFMSLGVGVKAIHYFLIGLALLILGLATFLRRRRKVFELRFNIAAPEK
jgi:hypothetical protein